MVDDRAEDPRAFWSDLEQRRVVTNNDALHGLFLTAKDGDAFESYEARLAQAVALGWLPRGRDAASMPANESARMGDLAMAACRIADIRGGLTMLVTGLSPRYATRELIAMEIIPERTEDQALTGLEFIEFSSRLQDRITFGGRTPSAEDRLRQAEPEQPAAPRPNTTPEPSPDPGSPAGSPGGDDAAGDPPPGEGESVEAGTPE